VRQIYSAHNPHSNSLMTDSDSDSSMEENKSSSSSSAAAAVKLPSPVLRAKEQMEAELGLFLTTVVPDMERQTVSLPQSMIHQIGFVFYLSSFLFAFSQSAVASRGDCFLFSIFI
jgi:hypothetical protein